MQIYLRALREYSERCQPPSLTPDCPYSIDIDSGVRGCAEECMDLLAKHNAPNPIEEIDLGDGLSIRRPRRPRARRSLAATTRAFDAREIYLEDEGSELISRWKLASILYGLLEEIGSPPSADSKEVEDRQLRISSLIMHANEKGLDFDVHILTSIRPAIAMAVFARLVGSLEDKEALREFDHTGGWTSLLDNALDAEDIAEGETAMGRVSSKLFGALHNWASTATVDQLFSWTPPDHQLFENRYIRRLHDRDDDGTWMVERFTKTYLQQWATSSLKREWQYLHGQHPAPCHANEMSVRRIEESELALEMADRLANHTPVNQPLANSLVGSAVNFIGEGRRLEAAALFEAAVHHEPESSDALNNLGFCLLPDQPERAIEYFEKASTTGRGDLGLIEANRILALALSRRYTSAMDLATLYLDRELPSKSNSSNYLWDVESVFYGSSPKLIKNQDLKQYVEDILTKINLLFHIE